MSTIKNKNKQGKIALILNTRVTKVIQGVNMYSNNKVAKAVRLAMMFGAATAVSVPAFAAEEAEGATDVERIQVTGSRIKRADLESASPVTIVTAADIKKTGLISIGDLLQDLPSAGSALNTAVNNGGDGSVRVDLRNLGSQRVLVLVNGKRWMNSASSGVGSSVDLNTIPVAAIARMEVLKDGASAVYGSDAIAGVVNIITKKDFEGAELNVYYGETEEGDGRQRHVDFTFGITGEKGSFLATVNYDNQGTIWAGDRKQSDTGYSSSPPWGRYRQLNNILGGDYASNMTLQGANLSDGLQTSDFTGFSFGDADSAGNRYNYAPTNYLLTPNERTSVYLSGNYEISDTLNFSSDFVYSNRKSVQNLAAMPLTLGFIFGPNSAQGGISATNPYNPFGIDLYFDNNDMNGDGELTGNENAFYLQRRMLEAGLRVYTQDVHTYRYSATIEGEINDSWAWDASFIYGESRNTSDTTGLLNMQAIGLALGDLDTCNNTSGCVPLNLFGEGVVTQEMADYITFQGTDSNTQRMLDYSINVNGMLFELPAGEVYMAAGFEHRLESGTDVPNPYTQAGISSGNQRNATSGGFRLDEYYAEFSVPVVEDMLDLSLAARRTEHSTYGSNTTTKIGAEFRPMDNLMFRATLAEGFRAPSIANLFGGGGDSYPRITDPCNGGATANPNNPGCAGVPDTYTQSNPQIRTSQTSEVGPGEAELQPETSESFTAGFVYSPEFLDGFEITLDYFDIEVKDSIGRVGAATIVTQCATTGTIYCNKMDRSPITGDIVDIRNNFINSGGTETSGVDINMTYRFETEFGDFKLSADTTYLDEYTDINEDPAGGADTEIKRAGLQYGDFGLPRWKGTFGVDWTMDDLTVSWTGRYIHDVCLNPGDTGLDCNASSQELSDNYQTNPDALFYQDLQATYFVSDYNMSVTVGVKNVFDEQPDQEFDPEIWWGGLSANNFDASLYDPNLARFMYVNVGVKF